jgi:ABC-type glycerol-3-phosphate transport system permease component
VSAVSVREIFDTDGIKPIAVPRIRISGVVINLLILVGVGCTLVPSVYMVTAGFKSNSEIFGYPVTRWPRHFILSNYRELFSQFPFARWYLNTVIVAVVGTALNGFLAALAGFSFAKYRFRFRNALFVVLLFTFMLPGQVLLLPPRLSPIDSGCGAAATTNARSSS